VPYSYFVYVGTKTHQESTEPVNAMALSPATRSYTLKGLKKLTGYFIVMRAANALGTGAASNQVSAIA
jgi:hypothetical protein